MKSYCKLAILCLTALSCGTEEKQLSQDDDEQVVIEDAFHPLQRCYELLDEAFNTLDECLQRGETCELKGLRLAKKSDDCVDEVKEEECSDEPNDDLIIACRVQLQAEFKTYAGKRGKKARDARKQGGY